MSHSFPPNLKGSKLDKEINVLDSGGKLWDKMISYEFFGNVFNVYTIGIVFNIVLMIIFTIISSNVFKKQEVK